MSLTLNIVHLKHRTDRWKLLCKELEDQQITDYKIWDGVVDESQPPYKGIAKAHKQVVKFAKESGLTSVLIAQDDIKFTSKGAYRYYLDSIPIDYDLFLGSIYYGEIKSNKTVNDFAGLTLFLVHERFYNVFLSLPENDHLDRALHSRGRFVVCEPFVAIQYNGYSDNRQAYCNYDIYLQDRSLFGCE